MMWIGLTVTINLKNRRGLQAQVETLNAKLIITRYFTEAPDVRASVDVRIGTLLSAEQDATSFKLIQPFCHAIGSMDACVLC